MFFNILCIILGLGCQSGQGQATAFAGAQPAPSTACNQEWCQASMPPPQPRRERPERKR
jgi:hypothetical protein